MSEYQYYEFQAIDRPLSEKEMARLRTFSSRARITPTSFVNEYDWGSFKGDEDAWMARYFDAFLYLANWGARVVKLRLPARLLPLRTARRYCPGDSAGAVEKSGNVIVSLVSDSEEGDWEEGEGWLASIVPVRAELARGDLRALYLGWLACAQAGELDDDAPEPPVPPGLGALTGSLQNLALFLRVDEHLIAAAAEASAPAEGGGKAGEDRAVARWIAGLPAAEKDQLLMALVRGEGAHLGNDLLARFRKERGAAAAPASGPARTAGRLLARAEELQRIAAKAAAGKAAAAKARREAAEAAAREKRLDGLAGREPELWSKVEKSIATREPAGYDEAVKTLLDLRGLAERSGQQADFRRKLEALRTAHGRKPTFIKRMEKTGL